MAEWRQLMEAMPQDWWVRAGLILVTVLCYGALVRGICAFTAFGSHDDEY